MADKPSGGGVNGWDQWGRHVLVKLGDIDNRLGSLDEGYNKLSIDIATLKVKSGVWGAFGAMIPIIVATIVWMLMK